MSNNIQKATNQGFPFMSILAIVFITLRLCDTITWSWWWVLVPLWGPVAIYLFILVVALIAIGIKVLIHKKR